MARLRPWPVTALVAWTLFTWGNRIPLLWASSTQTRSEKVLGTIPIAVFVVFALATLVLLVRAERPGGVLVGRARTVALGLAGWSVAYWLVRLPLILVHHHPVPFKVVHSVLAAVAVGLSVWVVRTLVSAGRRPATASSSDTRPLPSGTR